MPEFQGICGRFTPTPCTLAWSSTYRNDIGTYPSQLLPATRTIYHIAGDSGYNFTAPLVGLGETLGAPLVGGLIFGLGGFSPPQFDTFIPQSHFATIFAQTANRINIPHVLTQEEIDAGANSPEGFKLDLDVGEYIFEFIAVTDQQLILERELTDEEREEINETGESESDRIFRKLFQLNIPDGENRLLGVERNKRGIEYRFDNGGIKARSALGLAGIGNVTSTTYKDGSSRVVAIDIAKLTERRTLLPGEPAPPEGSLAFESRKPRAGDIIYLTYVGIKNHYIRQNVEASWFIQAQSIPPVAYGSPSRIKVANYRFYEWFIESAETPLPVKVAGWRIVESFNIPSNVVASVGSPGEVPEIGQFFLKTSSGREFDGLTNITVLDTNEINDVELDTYIEDIAEFGSSDSPRSTFYNVNIDRDIQGGSYHRQFDQAFRKSPWYLDGRATTYNQYNEVISHVFYNVHPKALLKRDVDKFGIERSLAQAIETDINQGKDTFFPFMDDPVEVNPTGGIEIYLDSSNTRFEPFQPVSSYTVANLEIEAGVAGSIQLGRAPQLRGTANDDIVAVYNFNSNILTEFMEDDTRILVERNFTTGQRGPRTLAIEGLAGQVGALTCFMDPSKIYSFAAHVDDENLLIFNKFSTAQINEGLKKLQYRPDLGTPPVVDNEDPKPIQFEELLGYNGMLGDIPGVSPGGIVSITAYSSLTTFKYKSTSRSKVLIEMPLVDEEQVTEINISKTEDRYTIPLESGYYGRTDIYFTCNQNVNALIQFKTGNGINAIVDNVLFTKTPGLTKLRVPHYWLKGDTIEIVSDDIANVTIRDVIVHELTGEAAEDFLSNSPTSTEDEKNAVQRGDFYVRPVFFSTNTMTMAEDYKSRIFIFFNDADGGISCTQSDDYGTNWAFHYGIIEPIQQEESRHPFALTVPEINSCFIFYLFKGKILCKQIPFGLFEFEDALLIERFEADRLQVEEGETTVELSGLFSSSGRIMRRGIVSFAAAGDMTDDFFREFTGRDLTTNDYDAIEVRTVDTVNGPAAVPTRKVPISIAPGTAFTDRDIDNIYYSAYRTDKGIMKLFFLLPSANSLNGGNQLQCHFSVDNGRTWYDYWEWIEHGYRRLRSDANTNSQWIDRAATGEEEVVLADNPKISEQDAHFGINVHWSRLLKDKTGEGDLSISSESQVIDISSPYLFYQPTTKLVFLFYVYSDCLLCKIFSDDIFSDAATAKRQEQPFSGMEQVKTILERQTRAHFVDGDLSTDDIREEVHRYFNEDTNEIMAQGNIIFTHQFGIETFNSNRSIETQRVCAYELPQGGIRVFYKHKNSQSLRTAIYTGSEWYVEDLMRDGNLDDPLLTSPASATEVCGAFGGDGFVCGSVGITDLGD